MVLETSDVLDVSRLCSPDDRQIGRRRNSIGDEFVGEYDTDVLSGLGVMNYVDGACYVGDYFRNNRHGLGVYRYTNLDVYQGEWDLEEKHGVGTCRFLGTGDLFEGEYRHNKRSGHGAYRWKNGSVQMANFVDGVVSGPGMLKWLEGRVYFGDFVDDKRQGFGVCFYPNGDVYEGEFKDDLRHGYGSYTFAESDHVDSGYWTADAFVGDLKGPLVNDAHVLVDGRRRRLASVESQESSLSDVTAPSTGSSSAASEEELARDNNNDANNDETSSSASHFPQQPTDTPRSHQSLQPIDTPKSQAKPTSSPDRPNATEPDAKPHVATNVHAAVAYANERMLVAHEVTKKVMVVVAKARDIRQQTVDRCKMVHQMTCTVNKELALAPPTYFEALFDAIEEPEENDGYLLKCRDSLLMVDERNSATTASTVEPTSVGSTLLHRCPSVVESDIPASARSFAQDSHNWFDKQHRDMEDIKQKRPKRRPPPPPSAASQQHGLPAKLDSEAFKLGPVPRHRLAHQGLDMYERLWEDSPRTIDSECFGSFSSVGSADSAESGNNPDVREEQHGRSGVEEDQNGVEEVPDQTVQPNQQAADGTGLTSSPPHQLTSNPGRLASILLERGESLRAREAEIDDSDSSTDGESEDDEQVLVQARASPNSTGTNSLVARFRYQPKLGSVADAQHLAAVQRMKNAVLFPSGEAQQAKQQQQQNESVLLSQEQMSPQHYEMRLKQMAQRLPAYLPTTTARPMSARSGAQTNSTFASAESTHNEASQQDPGVDRHANREPSLQRTWTNAQRQLYEKTLGGIDAEKRAAAIQQKDGLMYRAGSMGEESSGPSYPPVVVNEDGSFSYAMPPPYSPPASVMGDGEILPDEAFHFTGASAHQLGRSTAGSGAKYEPFSRLDSRHRTQAGSGQGSQMGSGQHSQMGSGQHSQMGSGQHSQMGSGQHSQMGSGQHSQMGSGQHSPIGSGQHSPIGSGQHSQSGSLRMPIRGPASTMRSANNLTLGSNPVNIIPPPPSSVVNGADSPLDGAQIPGRAIDEMTHLSASRGSQRTPSSQPVHAAPPATPQGVPGAEAVLLPPGVPPPSPPRVPPPSPPVVPSQRGDSGSNTDSPRSNASSYANPLGLPAQVVQRNAVAETTVPTVTPDSTPSLSPLQGQVGTAASNTNSVVSPRPPSIPPPMAPPSMGASSQGHQKIAREGISPPSVAPPQAPPMIDDNASEASMAMSISYASLTSTQMKEVMGPPSLFSGPPSADPARESPIEGVDLGHMVAKPSSPDAAQDPVRLAVPTPESSTDNGGDSQRGGESRLKNMARMLDQLKVFEEETSDHGSHGVPVASDSGKSNVEDTAKHGSPASLQPSPAEYRGYASSSSSPTFKGGSPPQTCPPQAPQRPPFPPDRPPYPPRRPVYPPLRPPYPPAQ